jgi:hypothetical protein
MQKLTQLTAALVLALLLPPRHSPRRKPSTSMAPTPSRASRTATSASRPSSAISTRRPARSYSTRPPRPATVDIEIDTKSVDTGYATFNEHIQGEDFLDTAKYPTATFKSTKVVFEGDKPVAIEGNC